MKLYMDNCCYNRPYDSQQHLLIELETKAKLHIQNLIKQNKIELSTSFILWYELSQNPYEIRKKGITDFIRNNSSSFVSSDNGKSIKERASRIMETGIKMKDAYHISCAIEDGCDYFLTTDKRLLRYHSEEIKICNPIDFIKEIGDDEL